MRARHGQDRKRSPFRRRKKPSDAAAEAAVPVPAERAPTADPAPGEMAQLIVDVRRGAVDREAADQIARPLNDLARAFAMQAELLKTVHEGQERLHEVMRDDQRMAMMVNSTDALNETFRGVRSVQAGLMERLEAADRRAGRWRILGVISIVVALGAGVWAVITALSRVADEKADLEDRMARIETDLLPERERGLVEATAAAEREKAARAALERDLEDLRAEVESARAAIREKEARIEALRETAAAAETDKAGAAREIERLQREVARYLKRLEVAEERNATLQEDLIAKVAAAARKGALDDVIATPIVAPTSSDAGSEASSSSAAPVPVSSPVLDAQGAERLRASLNGLLSKHRSSHVYAIESIGGVAADHLTDVVVTESVPGRGVVKRIEAKRLSFAVSPQGDMVDLKFSEGRVRQGDGRRLGPPTPFYNGRFRLTVYCLNGEEWLARDDAFITVD